MIFAYQINQYLESYLPPKNISFTRFRKFDIFKPPARAHEARELNTENSNVEPEFLAGNAIAYGRQITLEMVAITTATIGRLFIMSLRGKSKNGIGLDSPSSMFRDTPAIPVAKHAEFKKNIALSERTERFAE